MPTFERKHVLHTLATAFFVALLALTLFAPSAVHGQTTPPPTTAPATAPTATGVDKANAAPKADSVSPLTSLGQTVGNIMLGIGSGVTGIGGLLLDASIGQFILRLTENVGSGSPIGNAIENTWLLIRDIGNLAFIFGFIYIGIMTILNKDGNDTKRMLAAIIVGAFLVNFSLFFVRIIVDISNYIAVEIYNALISGTGSLSTNIREIMGISTIFKMPSSVDQYVNQTAWGNVWFYFMGTIFLIVAGFVFAAGAILIMMRYVTLIFIMIFSPLLFAAAVFPATAGQAHKLWEKLFQTAFFAPAYLILLVVSIKILEAISISSGFRNVKMSDAILGNSGSFEVIVNFCLAIMFMMMSLQAAQKFGIMGAEKVVGTTKKLIGASTAGLVARAGRASFGHWADKKSNDEGLKDRASQSGFGGFVARQQLKASRVVADTSFDARKVGGAGKAMGIGDGRKGGFTTVQHELEAKEMKFAKSLGEVDDKDHEVEARKNAMEGAQRKLRDNQDRLRKRIRDLDVTDPERDKAIKKLNELQDNEKDTQEAYKREKNRRVVGSASNIEAEKAVKTAKDSLAKEKENLQKTYADAAKETDEKLKAELLQQATMQEKQVTDAQKAYKEAYKEAAKNGGYAGVLQNSRWFTSWPKGRLAFMEHHAGEEMRKTYEKKFKKTKDDARHEEFVEAAKSAAKGGDAH